MRRALGLVGRKLAAPEQSQSAPRTASAPRSTQMQTPERHKRRFVSDGEVPVTVLRREHGVDAPPLRPASGASPSNRLDAAEAALRAERGARERAERALAEAQALIRDLRTKLGHAELARNEALETAKTEIAAAASSRAAANEELNQLHAARAAQQAAEQQLADERIARERAERALREARRAAEPSERGSGKVEAEGADPPPLQLPRKPALPRKRMASKPQPTIDVGEQQPVRWWVKKRAIPKRR